MQASAPSTVRPNEMVWAIGSTNKGKVGAVEAVARRCFPNHQHVFRSKTTSTGVSLQPMTTEEMRAGARNRAQEALMSGCGDETFGVGIEGGFEKVEEKYFECGWMCIIERSTGRYGWGSSARFEASRKIMAKIIDEGKELADVMDEMTGEVDLRSSIGAMGVLTGGHISRVEAYTHGLIFALAPFLSDQKTFWD